MQPDLELKFPEQSIQLRFLDIGTEISSERTRASQSNWTTQEPNGTCTPSQYIKYPSPVISNFIGWKKTSIADFNSDGKSQWSIRLLICIERNQLWWQISMFALSGMMFALKRYGSSETRIETYIVIIILLVLKYI